MVKLFVLHHRWEFPGSGPAEVLWDLNTPEQYREAVRE